MNTQNEKEPDPDRAINQKSLSIGLISLWIGVGGILLSVVLFLIVPPSDNTKFLLWNYLTLLCFVVGTLALLIAPSLKYHRHYKQWCSNVAALQSAAEAIANLKLDDAASKADNASQELKKAIEQAASLHQKSSEQLHLLSQTTSRNQELMGALAELKSVVPITKGAIHELQVLTGLFLNIPELRGQIYTLNNLTLLESSIPDNSIVVIQRPEGIRKKNNEQLTTIMENNASRGVVYKVIADEMPAQWKSLKGLIHLSGDGGFSYVLPSLGFVLYLVDINAQGDWKNPYSWHTQPIKKSTFSSAPSVAGFVLLPIPHKDNDLTHSYLALRMISDDINELCNRIFK